VNHCSTRYVAGITQPAKTSLAIGEETSFIVTMQPAAGSAPGPRTATVNIASNAPDSPFRFTLTGAKATPLQTWRLTWFGQTRVRLRFSNKPVWAWFTTRNRI